MVKVCKGLCNGSIESLLELQIQCEQRPKNDQTWYLFNMQPAVLRAHGQMLKFKLLFYRAYS